MINLKSITKTDRHGTVIGYALPGGSSTKSRADAVETIDAINKRLSVQTVQIHAVYHAPVARASVTRGSAHNRYFLGV